MLSFLFPKACALCGKLVEDSKSHLCNRCKKKQIYLKEPLCYSCGKSLDAGEREYCGDCKRLPKSFVKGAGLCQYTKDVKEALSAIKYKNQRFRTRFFVEETIRRRGDYLKALKVDAIVPVPLHPKKRRQRGFNQAEIFAKGLGTYLGYPVCSKIVKRTHYTRPQKELDPDERQKNLKTAFVGNEIEYKRQGAPKRVLVVDDIYTTGATAQGVCKALMDMGVREVYIFSIAIGKGQ